MQASQLKKVDESLSEQNESEYGDNPNNNKNQIIGGQMQLSKDQPYNPMMMPPALQGNLVGNFDPSFNAEIEFY